MRRLLPVTPQATEPAAPGASRLSSRAGTELVTQPSGRHLPGYGSATCVTKRRRPPYTFILR